MKGVSLDRGDGHHSRQGGKEFKVGTVFDVVIQPGSLIPTPARPWHSPAPSTALFPDDDAQAARWRR